MASDDEDDYRLQHTAPDAEYGAPLHDVTKHMSDFYENPHYFHGGLPHDHESTRKILNAHGEPDKMIHVYRALPAEHAHKGIRPGDWVSTSKEYARNEGRTTRNAKDDFPVIRAKVPAKHLHTEGDVNEWGYNGPETVHGMVVYKGGHNQEVRHNADGEIKQVQRRPKKEDAFKGYDITHHQSDIGTDTHMHHVEAYGPEENYVGHLHAKPGQDPHEIHVEPGHPGLEDRMRSVLPKIGVQAAMSRLANAMSDALGSGSANR